MSKRKGDGRPVDLEPDGECMRCGAAWPQGVKRCPECNWDGWDMGHMYTTDWIDEVNSDGYPLGIGGLFEAAAKRLREEKSRDVS